MNITAIEIIHESLVNGNRYQMVEQIKEYGLNDFFGDYRFYLMTTYDDTEQSFKCFTDCTIFFMWTFNR